MISKYYLNILFINLNPQCSDEFFFGAGVEVFAINVADEQIDTSPDVVVIGSYTEKKNLNFSSKIIFGKVYDTFYIQFTQSHDLLRFFSRGCCSKTKLFDYILKVKKKKVK